MNIFEMQYQNSIKKEGPLAERMRPLSLSEFVGQDHIVGEGKILSRAIEADKLTSAIFTGLPEPGRQPWPKLLQIPQTTILPP